MNQDNKPALYTNEERALLAAQQCYGCGHFGYDETLRSPFLCRHGRDARWFYSRETPSWCPGRAETIPEEKKCECHGCGHFGYDETLRSPFMCNGREVICRFSTYQTPSWCPGRVEAIEKVGEKDKAEISEAEENNKMQSDNVSKASADEDVVACAACGKTTCDDICCKKYKEKRIKANDKMEKLPTKKEVIKKLQDACDVINNGNTSKGYIVHVNDDFSSLHQIFCCYNEQPIGNAHQHRPEPKPPEGLSVVQLRDQARNKTIIGVSRGSFDRLGDLQCFATAANKDEDIGWSGWKCIKTGEHSENWEGDWNLEGV